MKIRGLFSRRFQGVWESRITWLDNECTCGTGQTLEQSLFDAILGRVSLKEKIPRLSEISLAKKK
ncbi:MAG: hypothetical protein M1505_00790 [Patescibacteria group bacterium]|nr:hypothetical protein [Patescibacteria group bacterium]MCL5257756.1 hypothetical protein [Patescibacteria group bacterium]